MKWRERFQHLRQAVGGTSRNGHAKANGSSIGIPYGYLDALRPSLERPYQFGTPLPADGSTPILDRAGLSALTRWLCDNSGVVSYAIETIANYAVPVVPQAASGDAAWDDQAEAIWTDWAANADFAGRWDFFSLQQIACMATDLDGDVGMQAIVDAGSMKLAIIEGHRITTPPKQAANPRLCDGVETDAAGRLVAYHVSTGERSWTPIPASQLFLWFEPDPSRPNAFRGLSPLRRGLNDVRDGKDIKGYEKMAARIHGAIAAVIKTHDGRIDPIVFGTSVPNGFAESTPPAPGEPAPAEPAKKKEISVTDILSGSIPVLGDGEELQLVETNRPSANTREFLDVLAAHFVMGLGLPAAFFLDARLTGPNTRAVNGKAERKFRRRQAIACRFTFWTWIRVIGQAIDNGLLPSHPGWASISFQTPPRLSIDIGGEESADLAAVLDGVMSLGDYNAKRGRDGMQTAMRNIDERAAIIAYAIGKAALLGVPVEMLLPKYIAEGGKVPAPSPDSEAGPRPAPADEDEDEEDTGDQEEEEEKKKEEEPA